MKYLFVSDAHGNIEQLKRIHNFAQADKSFSLGDNEINDEFVEPLYVSVQGNNDFCSQFPKVVKFRNHDFTFYLTHGHKEGVYIDRTQLSYKAADNGANIAIYGHSHIANVEIIGDVLIINPGSISYPRAKDPATFCIMEIINDEITINFHQVSNFDIIKQLSKKVVFYFILMSFLIFFFQWGTFFFLPVAFCFFGTLEAFLGTVTLL